MKERTYAGKACKMTEVARRGDDIHSHQEEAEKISLTGGGEPITSHLEKLEAK